MGKKDVYTIAGKEACREAILCAVELGRVTKELLIRDQQLFVCRKAFRQVQIFLCTVYAEMPMGRHRKSMLPMPSVVETVPSL